MTLAFPPAICAGSKNPTDILDRIDLALVTDSLRKLLEIRNRAEQTVALDDVHAAEIKGVSGLAGLDAGD